MSRRSLRPQRRRPAPRSAAPELSPLAAMRQSLIAVNPALADDQMLSPAQVASIWSISQDAVRELALAGEVPARVTISKGGRSTVAISVAHARQKWGGH